MRMTELTMCLFYNFSHMQQKHAAERIVAIFELLALTDFDQLISN